MNRTPTLLGECLLGDGGVFSDAWIVGVGNSIVKDETQPRHPSFTH